MTLIIVTPSPDHRWVLMARDLSRRGLRNIVVLVDPTTFGQALPLDEPLALLQASATPTYVVRRDDPLGASLSVPV
jgi:hypothetical protein